MAEYLSHDPMPQANRVSSDDNSQARIHVVGIGLDGVTGLSVESQRQIEAATLLVGSDRHLSYFPHHSAQRVALSSLHDAFAAIRDHLHEATADADGKAVVLTSGDPLFFGLGRLLLAEFSAADLVFHPHLSSVQLAFSRIKIPWQDAKVISAHGRSLDELLQALQKDTEKIAVLTDETNTPQAIARLIESLDRPQHYRLWVCENLGSAAERITVHSIRDLANPALNFVAAPLNVVVALRGSALDLVASQSLASHPVVTDSNFPYWLASASALTPAPPQDFPVLGIPDSAFASFGDRPGLMTKREIRLLALGELSLKPNQVLWDIGAGTGSLSIEAARLCSTSTIYAIEKTAAGIQLIRTNAQRFQTANVTPIQGQAPDILASLPRPHSIFIGGSGSHLDDILSHCCTQIQPGGTLVMAIATLEHLAIAIHWINSKEAAPHIYAHRLLACQLSRSTPIATLTRMTPLNPIHLLTITYA